jgi:hypothetical protein
MQNQCPYSQSAFLDLLSLLLRQFFRIQQEESLQAQLQKLRDLLLNRSRIPDLSVLTTSFSLNLVKSYTILLSMPWKEEYTTCFLQILDQLLVKDPSAFALLCDEFTTIVPQISTPALKLLTEVLLRCIIQVGGKTSGAVKAAELLANIFEQDLEAITPDLRSSSWSKIQHNWANIHPNSPSHLEAYICLWALLAPKTPGMYMFITTLPEPLAQEYLKFISFIRPYLHDLSVRTGF